MPQVLPVRATSGAGRNICILEARERIGGRIFTIHPPDLPLPIELGAEFVHGEAHARTRCQSASLST